MSPYLSKTMSDNINTENEKSGGSILTSKRWRLCFLLFLAYTVLILHRVNLSMAIVCIVRDPSQPHPLTGTLNISGHNNSDISAWTTVTSADRMGHNGVQGNEIGDTNQTLADTDTAFSVDWDKSVTSVLLSSYFYGSIVTQIPAGKMADAIGGKLIIFIAFVLTAVCSLLTPICVRTHIALVFVLRILIGLAGGTVVPVGVSMLGAWAPPRERAVMIALSGNGFSVGPVLSYLTSGYLCAYGFDGGWPSVFYIHGIVASLFAVLWWFQAYSSPDDHPRISRREMAYIKAARTNIPMVQNVKTPWRSIWTSRPMWGSIVAHFVFNWGYYSLLINVPMFMKEVLQFDIRQNGFFSALPYMAFFGANLLWAQASFTLFSKRWLEVLTIRRVFTCTSFVGSSVCLILAGHMNVEFRHYSVVLLCVTCVLTAMCFSGFLANHAEYSGVHSGTTYGISNGIAVIAAILAAIFAGVLTPNGSQREWQHVFYLSAALSVLGSVIYYACSSTTLQKWAEFKPQDGDAPNHEIVVLTKQEQNNTEE